MVRDSRRRGPTSGRAPHQEAEHKNVQVQTQLDSPIAGRPGNDAQDDETENSDDAKYDFALPDRHVHRDYEQWMKTHQSSTTAPGSGPATDGSRDGNSQVGLSQGHHIPQNHTLRPTNKSTPTRRSVRFVDPNYEMAGPSRRRNLRRQCDDSSIEQCLELHDDGGIIMLNDEGTRVLREDEYDRIDPIASYFCKNMIQRFIRLLLWPVRNRTWTLKWSIISLLWPRSLSLQRVEDFVLERAYRVLPRELALSFEGALRWWRILTSLLPFRQRGHVLLTLWVVQQAYSWFTSRPRHDIAISEIWKDIRVDESDDGAVHTPASSDTEINEYGDDAKRAHSEEESSESDDEGIEGIMKLRRPDEDSEPLPRVTQASRYNRPLPSPRGTFYSIDFGPRGTSRKPPSSPARSPTDRRSRPVLSLITQGLSDEDEANEESSEAEQSAVRAGGSNEEQRSLAPPPNTHSTDPRHDSIVHKPANGGDN